ncbi:MAG TPA: OpgC domain-containing protein, partial [Stellaceae bacterium]|nr:OpgC domain-containing protein [Stellaceae bacterium]
MDPFPRKGRDLRLDFFRGLSLFFIFIDHIPNNFLGWFTLHSIAFSDAAEVFIFISGYTAALVYGRSLYQHGRLFATAQIWRRVWQLYVAHIFLFVIFTAEVSYAILAVNNPMYSEELRVGDFLQQPHIAIIKAMLLQFQPTFLDILPLYIVLLAIFPLVLLTLERGALWALLPSAVVYALTLRHGWGIPAYPQSVWYFNPLAWQFLFVIGASAGHARVSGRWPFPKGKWFSQLAVAVSALAIVINLSWLIHRLYDPFPAILAKQLLSFAI